jgi:hypothetical protein
MISLTASISSVGFFEVEIGQTHGTASQDVYSENVFLFQAFLFCL